MDQDSKITHSSNEHSSPYQPLDETSQTIRLMRIHPRLKKSRRVRCTLFTARLEDNPQFTALSYVLGDPSITETIIANGQPVKVTKNLAAALRYIQETSGRFSMPSGQMGFASTRATSKKGDTKSRSWDSSIERQRWCAPGWDATSMGAASSWKTSNILVAFGTPARVVRWRHLKTDST